ncbi:hypothetical protein HK098_001742 [Nowakowskiella sp. JEL0407]|nr:hypothetical protein HK098_001742 [Nowakowskiella sp. JEL0407]
MDPRQLEIEPDHYYEPNGVPVFKPTFEQFKDFHRFMKSIDKFGLKSGIVKIIPPPEWHEIAKLDMAALKSFKIRNPISQEMSSFGLPSGCYRQVNLEKAKVYSPSDWFDVSNLAEYKVPLITDDGRIFKPSLPKKRRILKNFKREGDELVKNGSGVEKKVKVDVEQGDNVRANEIQIPPAAESNNATTNAVNTEVNQNQQPVNTKSTELNFNPEETSRYFSDEFCEALERTYWRNLTYVAPFYGADIPGSIFEKNKENTWNPACLDNILSNINVELPGVNKPYLYFGQWKATFSWHLEDLDLYSINYIHFGAPKHWYVIPPEHKQKFERLASSIFVDDAQRCSQFLRHKMCMISPTLLKKHEIQVHKMLQRAGEFVVTYPNGYHAGFNLGFNCAESVNFALDTWLEIGKRAKYCKCIKDSVRFDFSSLFDSQAQIPQEITVSSTENTSQTAESIPAPVKNIKKSILPKKRLKAIAGASQRSNICILCPGDSLEDLIETDYGDWKAHRKCGLFVPETSIVKSENGVERVIGIMNIPNDRWKLKCGICKRKPIENGKNIGACIQCARGRCLRSYHVSCAVTADISMVETSENGENPYCICPQHSGVKQTERMKIMNENASNLLSPGVKVITRVKGTAFEGTVSEVNYESQSCNVIWKAG